MKKFFNSITFKSEKQQVVPFVAFSKSSFSSASPPPHSPSSRGKRGWSFEGGARCWRTLNQQTFPPLHYVTRRRLSKKKGGGGGGSISLRATRHPWQARAKQMSHCHAKGSRNVFGGRRRFSFIACSTIILFPQRGGEDNVHEKIPLFLSRVSV